MSDVSSTPGPTANSVRATDGKVLTVPIGWILLPPGDAALTRRVKAASDHWVVAEKRGRKIFSRGIWAPEAIIASIRAELEAERSKESFVRKQQSSARRREKAQTEYVEDFLGAVVAFLAFHPEHAAVADRMAREGLSHCVRGHPARQDLGYRIHFCDDRITNALKYHSKSLFLLPCRFLCILSPQDFSTEFFDPLIQGEELAHGRLFRKQPEQKEGIRPFCPGGNKIAIRAAVNASTSIAKDQRAEDRLPVAGAMSKIVSHFVCRLFDKVCQFHSLDFTRRDVESLRDGVITSKNTPGTRKKQHCFGQWVKEMKKVFGRHSFDFIPGSTHVRERPQPLEPS